MFLELLDAFPKETQHDRVPPNKPTARPYIPENGEYPRPNIDYNERLRHIMAWMEQEICPDLDDISAQVEMIFNEPDKFANYTEGYRELCKYDKPTQIQLRLYLEALVSFVPSP